MAQKKRKPPLTVRLELPWGGGARPVLEDLRYRSKISSVKLRIEREMGFLPEMYQLSYLDAAPLEADSTLQDHDVIAGATLTVQAWRIWCDLMKAAYFGDASECFSLSSVDVTGDSDWCRHCAWCALYIASLRGHHSLVAELIARTSLAVNKASPVAGRTVLHAASRMGRWKVLCILLDSGADVRITDSAGMTAFDLSRKYGNKKCEHSLNFCQWNLQKHRIVLERKEDYDARKARRHGTRLAHQFRDSTLKTCLRGTQGQMYMMHKPNPITVGDVAAFQKTTKESENVSLPAVDSTLLTASRPTSSGDQKLEFNYGWFDPLRAQRLIPCTHDVLTYSDPSACRNTKQIQSSMLFRKLDDSEYPQMLSKSTNLERRT